MMLGSLETAVKAGDAKAVQDAVFDLGRLRDQSGIIGDDVALGVLQILRRDDLKDSPLAGHILNFFEFESPRISKRAKDRCNAFLKEWGDAFTDVHAMQVVAELTFGDYLK
jgi:hypothetical protein